MSSGVWYDPTSHEWSFDHCRVCGRRFVVGDNVHTLIDGTALGSCCLRHNHDWRTEIFRTSDGERVITFRDCLTCGRSETLSDVPTP